MSIPTATPPAAAVDSIVYAVINVEVEPGEDVFCWVDLYNSLEGATQSHLSDVKGAWAEHRCGEPFPADAAGDDDYDKAEQILINENACEVRIKCLRVQR